MKARLVSIAPCSSNCRRIEPQLEHQMIPVEKMTTTVMETTIAIIERMIGGILDADQPEAPTTMLIPVDQVVAVVLHATICLRRSSF
jgi:hypothetical protein